MFSCCKLQVFYLNATYVSHTHVASVCSKCFICFRRMLHLSVSCFRDMFRESWGHDPGTGGRDAASQGPADGIRGAPGVL